MIDTAHPIVPRCPGAESRKQYPRHSCHPYQTGLGSENSKASQSHFHLLRFHSSICGYPFTRTGTSVSHSFVQRPCFGMHVWLRIASLRRSILDHWGWAPGSLCLLQDLYGGRYHSWGQSLSPSVGEVSWPVNPL